MEKKDSNEEEKKKTAQEEDKEPSQNLITTITTQDTQKRYDELMGEFKSVKFDYDEKEQIMSILKAGDSAETKK
jgi:hypothetical protein